MMNRLWCFVHLSFVGSGIGKVTKICSNDFSRLCTAQERLKSHYQRPITYIEPLPVCQFYHPQGVSVCKSCVSGIEIVLLITILIKTKYSNNLHTATKLPRS
jgi:hypothetical protein